MPNLNQILVNCGNFLYHWRKPVLPIVFFGAVLVTQPALFLGSELMDYLITVLGLLVTLAGQTIRLLTIGFAYIHRGGKNRHVYATRLVTGGIYSHTRNPMYVGSFLIHLGLSIVYGSVFVTLVVLVVFGFVYLAVISAEEDFLKKKFGLEYEEFMNRVNRFWPDFRGLPATLKGFDYYDWRRVLRKESGTILGTVLGLVFILGWKTYFIYGFDAGKDELATLGILFAGALLFYGAVRYMRDKGYLTTSAQDDASDYGD
jgi:protein-S-isoprenylcysteine O-methyltransferase Ste14